jgi:hypothetical protein
MINYLGYFTSPPATPVSILTHKKLQRRTQPSVLSRQLLVTVKYICSNLIRPCTRSECGSQVCELRLCRGVSVPDVLKQRDFISKG